MDKNPEMQGKITPTPNAQPSNVGPSVSGVPMDVAAHDAPVLAPGSTPVSAPSSSPLPFAPVAAAANMPSGSVVMSADAPKKKKTGLLVGIIVAVLLLLVGGGALLWCTLFYNNPENVAFDAINGFLHEKNISVSGSAWVEVPSEDLRVDISLKNAVNQASGMSDLSIKLGEMQDGYHPSQEKTFDIDAGMIGLLDGKFYARFGNIMNSVDQLMDDENMTFDNLGQFEQMLYQLGETIDEQWWEISISDIIDRLTEDVDDEDTLAQVENAHDLYRCMIDVASQNHSNEIAKLYRANRFLVVKRVTESMDGDKKPASGNSLYELSFDYEKLADFLNALPKTEFANQSDVCINNYQAEVYSNSGYVPDEIDASKFDQIKAEELEEALYNRANQYYLEISNWQHQIKSIFILNLTSGAVSGADLYFDYTPVTISAPNDVRPITDLYDEAMEIIEESLNVDLDWSLDLDFGDDYDDDYGYVNVGTFNLGDDIVCDVYDYNDDDETFNCLRFIEPESWAEEV